MKKTVSMLLVLCMVITTLMGTVVVNVNASQGEDVIFDLNSLGITKGVDVNNRLDSPITRGEFSQLVVNMMGQQEVAMSMSLASYFADTSNNQYAGAINLLYEEGIVSGIGDGTFMPDRNVRYTEACKMLVKALGYDVIVEGNSLDAFTYTAGVIGVTDNVNSANEYITVKDMLIMINNCLDIDKMVPMYYNDNISPSYEIDAGNTFRRDLSKNNPDGFVKMRGVVTADVSTYLYSFNAALRNTQLEIEGQVFDYNGVAPLGYVGVEVDFYVSTTDDGSYGKITSIKTRDKNVITSIDGTDVASYTNDEIKYYVSDKKTEKVKTNLATIWIYNNDLYDGFNLSMVDLKGNTDLRAIDNDEDEIADVVFVFEYEDCVVETFNPEFYTVTFENGYYYENEKSLNLNVKETNAYIEYYDENGKATDFSAIKEGSVLSVARSVDKLNVRIVVSNKDGQGLVEMKDDEYITIGQTEFHAGKFDIKDINIGYNYTYKLNFKGQLVCMDEILTESDYGYVYAVQSKGLGDMKVKLIIPAITSSKVAIKDDEETEEETEDDDEPVKELWIRNENILIYNVAQKFTYEYWEKNAEGEYILRSARLSATADNLNRVLEQPVKYSVDSNNKINKFSMPKPSTVGYRCYYNNENDENVFGQVAVGGEPFGIDANTYALCIPTNTDATNDDILNDCEKLKGEDSYNVDAYDVSDSHVAKLIVVKKKMEFIPGGNVAERNKYSGLVTKASEVYNPETDESSIQITMITNVDKTEMTYTVSPMLDNYADFKQISKGDYISYGLDMFDRLNAFEMQQSFDSWYERTNGTSGITHFVGTVTDMEFDVISNESSCWMDKLTVNNVNGTKYYELAHNTGSLLSKPVVYIMNKDAEARLAEVSDIAYGDTVYVFGEGKKVYTVIVLR